MRAACLHRSAYGLFVDVNALNLVNLDAGPLPVGVNGTAPGPYADSDTVLKVDISAGIPSSRWQASMPVR